MFSFEEYCEIYDTFQEKAFYIKWKKSPIVNSESRSVRINSLLLCAAINDIRDDEAYFEAIINQSDIETLNKLLPYFTEGTRIARIISDRIQLMQQYGGKGNRQRARGDSILERTFFPYLCSWIDKKGFASDSDFYNQAGISRQAFSKMRNNKTPISREMALHLAVALGLNYEEAVEFLNYTGYNFNPNSRREQIISFLMRKRQYSFYEIEELLSILNEKTFLSWD